jgi:hypothetical protein
MVEEIERLRPKLSGYAVVDRDFLDPREIRIYESRRAKITEHARRVAIGKRRGLTKVVDVEVFIETV